MSLRDNGALLLLEQQDGAALLDSPALVIFVHEGRAGFSSSAAPSWWCVFRSDIGTVSARTRWWSIWSPKAAPRAPATQPRAGPAGVASGGVLSASGGGQGGRTPGGRLHGGVVGPRHGGRRIQRELARRPERGQPRAPPPPRPHGCRRRPSSPAPLRHRPCAAAARSRASITAPAPLRPRPGWPGRSGGRGHHRTPRPHRRCRPTPQWGGPRGRGRRKGGCGQPTAHPGPAVRVRNADARHPRGLHDRPAAGLGEVAQSRVRVDGHRVADGLEHGHVTHGVGVGIRGAQVIARAPRPARA